MARFKNLGDLIRRDRDLTKVAIIDLGGEEVPTEYTYLELDAMTVGVARALAKRGFKRGDRVAILSANRAEFIAAYFGIMRAGFVAVPVNYRFPKKTIHLIIADAGAKLVFCDKASRDNCPEDLPAVVFGEDGREGFGRFVERGEFETVTPKKHEPAMFLYTSGSTGIPKGVVLSHQSHIWVVETRLTPDLERHRYLIAAPLYHMNALALAKLACAAHATIVLLPKFEAKAYIEAIGHYRPTWLTAVPPMIAMMLREPKTLAKTDLSSVEFIRMGSAPVSASLMESIHRALPKAKATNAYGTTEAGPVVFGPHPKGSAAAGQLRRLSASEGAASPGRWREQESHAGRAGDEMPGADERLSQPAEVQAASPRTASTSPATFCAATRTDSIISSAAPTTCSSPAARTSIRPTSSACWKSIPMSGRPW